MERSGARIYLSLAGKALLLGAILSACASPAAQAQEDAAAAPHANPAPSRAARLSFFTGAVQVQRADNTGEDTPALNMPLTVGTRILCGDYAQAEIEFEDGSVARLTPRSALSINKLSLDAGVSHTELALLGGLAYFELRKTALASYLVEAGGTVLTPMENMAVRIDAGTPPVSFAVLTGTAQVARPDSFTAEVRAGETLRPDEQTASQYALTAQLTPESWDTWNESRDRAAADEADQRTAARDAFAGTQGYGWAELDAHGSWYDVPGTGEIWQPANADEGFDPYGYGNWVYVNTSYVWASGYSWGWTPFRCGNWQYFANFGWGWQPNAQCGSFGYAGGGGGGVLIRGRYPPRYGQVIRPFPRPLRPRPLIPVHGPDGPRPPLLQGGQVRVAGATLMPMNRIAIPSPRSGSFVGHALLRDFPVDHVSRQPLLGIEPATRATVSSDGLRTTTGGSLAAPIIRRPAPLPGEPRPSPNAPIRPPGTSWRMPPPTPGSLPRPAPAAPLPAAPVHVQPPPPQTRPAAPIAQPRPPAAAPRIEPSGKPK